VRNHLARLVDKSGWLVRLDDGRFAVGGRLQHEVGGPELEANDIPF
jgi:hypothetical protein